MATPSAAYSLRLRVRLKNRPGALGRLASAIGMAGGNIGQFQGFDVRGPALVEDLAVDCVNEAHMQQVRDAVAAAPDVELLDWGDRTFELHRDGKIEVKSRLEVRDRDDLSMAYTPGVARVCNAIKDDPRRVYDVTIKRNTVAVVTDGTAVLGLGDLGPAAALRVMEGKALLFKNCAGVDAFPLCIDVNDTTGLAERVAAIVATVERVAPVFGGINLEDISSPTCFEVEDRLKERLDIPVFHDDQHGTAVVVLAALKNSLKIVGKEMRDLRIVIAGAGAAGVAIAKILSEAGVPVIIGADRKGAIHRGRDDLNEAKRRLAAMTNPDGLTGALGDLLHGADVFIGVSGPGLVTADDLRKMNDKPIVFAMANPEPEILPEDAEGIAAVMATGRSDFPNQINNVLAFPGIFRGALDVHAEAITESMKLAAATAIADAVSSDDLSPELVIPSVFDPVVAEQVAMKVAGAAVADSVARSAGTP
jgi:malate dehydrogenase (oxaloacetate-decarboxylating)